MAARGTKVYPGLATWDADEVPPWQARLVGLASVTLWLVIIVLGRWTAYSADRLLEVVACVATLCWFAVAYSDRAIAFPNMNGL